MTEESLLTLPVLVLKDHALFPHCIARFRLEQMSQMQRQILENASACNTLIFIVKSRSRIVEAPKPHPHCRGAQSQGQNQAPAEAQVNDPASEQQAGPLASSHPSNERRGGSVSFAVNGPYQCHSCKSVVSLSLFPIRTYRRSIHYPSRASVNETQAQRLSGYLRRDGFQRLNRNGTPTVNCKLGTSRVSPIPRLRSIILPGIYI